MGKSNTFISNLFSDNGRVSTMRFCAVLITISVSAVLLAVCASVIILSIQGQDIEWIGIAGAFGGLSALLGAALGAKGFQKRYENGTGK